MKMSAFYLTGNTDSIKTLRTARGHHWVKATAQSWEGSVQVRMYKSAETGKIMVAVTAGNGSTTECSKVIMEKPLEEMI